MMGTLTIMDLIVLRALLLVGITTALSAVRIEDLPVTNEPVIIPGQCDTVAGKAEFDMMRFAGWWHQIESYPTGTDGNCRSSRYTVAGNQFEVVDTVMDSNGAQHNVYTVTATADGHLTRTAGDVEETWTVLGTDYENYALLYKCENHNSTYRRVWSAKHSKTGELTAQSQSIMAPIIIANPPLDLLQYRRDDQSHEACFYYPPPNGNPVILRGQCDRNIPVVANFNFTRFSGVWYHIEKYPEPWVVGTCSGVRYTDNTKEARIDIRDWHFVNDVANVIDGYMTGVTGSSNQPRFITSLPSRKPDHNPDITTIISYLDVLLTDYTTYALTFSCINVNPFEQRITVWKLSRGRTISDAVNTNINQYLISRPELDQRYFESLVQNEDCRDSSFLVKSSIIVVLVCGILQSVL